MKDRVRIYQWNVNSYIELERSEYSKVLDDQKKFIETGIDAQVTYLVYNGGIITFPISLVGSICYISEETWKAWQIEDIEEEKMKRELKKEHDLNGWLDEN